MHLHTRPAFATIVIHRASAVKPAMDQPTDQQLLEQFLSGRDESCPICGYSLRDLRGGRCPECGDTLRLRVGVEHPKRAAFVTGVVGLAGSLGFSALLLALFLYRTLLLRPQAGFAWETCYLISAECLVSALLLTIWVLNGRRIRRLSAVARWILAFICAIVPFIELIVFVAYSR